MLISKEKFNWLSSFWDKKYSIFLRLIVIERDHESYISIFSNKLNIISLIEIIQYTRIKYKIFILSKYQFTVYNVWYMHVFTVYDLEDSEPKWGNPNGV